MFLYSHSVQKHLQYVFYCFPARHDCLSALYLVYVHLQKYQEYLYQFEIAVGLVYYQQVFPVLSLFLNLLLHRFFFSSRLEPVGTAFRIYPWKILIISVL